MQKVLRYYQVMCTFQYKSTFSITPALHCVNEALGQAVFRKTSWICCHQGARPSAVLNLGNGGASTCSSISRYILGKPSGHMPPPAAQLTAHKTRQQCFGQTKTSNKRQAFPSRWNFSIFRLQQHLAVNAPPVVSFIHGSTLNNKYKSVNHLTQL